MNHCFSLAKCLVKESRLISFGLDSIGYRSQSESPDAKPNTLRQNQDREKLVATDKQMLAQLAKGIESEPDPTKDKEKERKTIVNKWLADIAKELGVDAAKLKIGKPDEMVREPIEQYGIYMNGKHVGDMYAGYENDQAVDDPIKYTKEGTFTEVGFKYQVKQLERKIKK